MVKVALYQAYHGRNLPGNIITDLMRAKPDLVCLPEYMFVGPDEQSVIPSAARHDEYLERLNNLSRQLDCVLVGPTLLRQTGTSYKNTCYVISSGSVLGYYEKVNPYRNEGNAMVSPGREYKVFALDDFRLGVLICSDVLNPRSFQALAELAPQIVVVPVSAPYREAESVAEKFKRDQDLFVGGAKTVGCPVVKVSSVGAVAGHTVQGRSLVATPGGILFRILPENEHEPVLKILELEV